MSFKDKFIRFMYGRYGADELYRFLTVLFFALCIVNLFVNSIIIYFISIGVLLFQLLRVFSRNHPARRRENAKYLKMRNVFLPFFKKIKMRFQNRKTARYRSCPSCKATLKLPKRKGKHSTKCPRCGKEFNVHIYF